MGAFIKGFLFCSFSIMLHFFVLASAHEADQHGIFIENQGQWPSDVLFRAAIPSGDFYVLKHGFKYVFYPKNPGHDHLNTTNTTGQDNLRKMPEKPASDSCQAIEVHFINSNPQPAMEVNGQAETNYNYFLGHDPKHWASGLKAYSNVKLLQIYQGIDLELFHDNQGIKYNFIVHPAGDAAQIQMLYEGMTDLTLENNKLKTNTIFGNIIETIPWSYQSTGPSKKNVLCRYHIEKNTVSFRLGKEYNHKETLTIDPKLIFSTYSGSLADNWGFTATYDDAGNLYSGGIVFGTGFPVTNGVFQRTFGGEWDIGILKYDSTGTHLLYATYLGGAYSETPQSLIVNHQGDLIIYGTTSSPDFPITSNAVQTEFKGGTPMDDSGQHFAQPIPGISFLNGSDLYISRLSSDGKQLLSSTFLGGSENDGVMLQTQILVKNYGDQFKGEVNVDDEDNVYVASNTTSDDFPVINAFQPAFSGGSNDGIVFKMNPDLSELVWSSYLGGAGDDALYGIKTDRQHNVYVAGGTQSPDFPITQGTLKTQKPGYYDIDATVTRISASGDIILSSTFLGTNSYDQAYCIDIDSSQNVYVLGQTTGLYPVTSGVYANPHSGLFIHKMTPGLDTTYFSTVVGSGSGGPDISPTAFLVNECENIFISGWGGRLNAPERGYIGGSMFNLPITSNAIQKQTDGSDFYLMVLLQGAKQLLYATYFGEYGGVGEHVDGGTSRFDKRGIVYQSVCGSCGRTEGFPTTPGVWSNSNKSNNCNNAAFKFDLASLLARFDTDTPEFDHPGIRSGCYPLDIVFLNNSIGGESYHWDFGEGTTSDKKDSIPINYALPGTYQVALTATDINTCVRVSKAIGTINVFDYDFKIMPPDSICFGDQIKLQAQGGVIYQWEPGFSLDDPTIATPIAKPDTTTTYKVHVVDKNACEFEDSVEIKVIPQVIADFSYSKSYDCFETPRVDFTNTSVNASDFNWDFGDGNTTDEFEPVHQFTNQKDTTFTVTLHAGKSFCSSDKQLPVTNIKTFIPNFISPNNDGKNDVFEVITDKSVELKIFNRWGKKLLETDNYTNNWPAESVSSGVYFYEVILPDKKTTCTGWLHVMQ